MRFIIAILLTALLSGICTWYYPWWLLALVAFLVAFLIRQRSGRAFWSGFLGVALLWLICAVWKDIANGHILSVRMAKLFGLPGYPLFILVTVIVGGLVGGLAAWSGSVLGKNII